MVGLTKGKDITGQLGEIKQQNEALVRKVDELERTLSQQNLILEKMIAELGDRIDAWQRREEN